VVQIAGCLEICAGLVDECFLEAAQLTCTARDIFAVRWLAVQLSQHGAHARKQDEAGQAPKDRDADAPA